MSNRYINLDLVSTMAYDPVTQIMYIDFVGGGSATAMGETAIAIKQFVDQHCSVRVEPTDKSKESVNG